MATYTPNYNLEKPEATDNFKDFRESYNDNLDIIDQNLGGGGGGGSNVTWNQLVTQGTKIAEITINGTTTDVYAPTSGGGGKLSGINKNVALLFGGVGSGGVANYS